MQRSESGAGAVVCAVFATAMVACGGVEPGASGAADAGGARGSASSSADAAVTASGSGSASTSASSSSSGSGSSLDGRGGDAGAASSDASVPTDGGATYDAAMSPRDGGDAATGTPDAEAAYDPCPAAPEPCKVMPSGDSITVGAQSTDTGGYRVPLFHLSLQDEKNLTFVGPSNAGPATVDGVPFPSAHNGHSGYVIDTTGTRKGLLPLMAPNLVQFTPHIVLVMIGTNDVNDQLDLSTAPDRLASLVDATTTAAPDALVVVAQLTPTRTDSLNVDVQSYNAAIPNIVSTRAHAGKHVAMVNMYGAFTANANYKTALLFDGLHPTDAGYAVMAQVWYDAIRTFLH